MEKERNEVFHKGRRQGMKTAARTIGRSIDHAKRNMDEVIDFYENKLDGPAGGTWTTEKRKS